MDSEFSASGDVIDKSGKCSKCGRNKKLYLTSDGRMCKGCADKGGKAIRLYVTSSPPLPRG